MTHKDVDDDDLASADRRARRDAERLTWPTPRSTTAGPRARDLRASRRSRDLGRRHARALGRRRRRRARVDHDARRQGLRRSRHRHRGPGPYCAWRRRPRPPRVLGVTPHHLDHPDGELADDRCAAPRAGAPRTHGAARHRVLSRSDRGVLRRRVLQPPRPPRSPVGPRSTRSRPRSGNPHYFPELRAEGLDVHAVPPCTCRERSSRTRGSTSPLTLERKIEALFCHASQLVETGDWFRQFLRDSAEAAGRVAGVTYAEAFRRAVWRSGRGPTPSAARPGCARHSDCARSISIATTPPPNAASAGAGQAAGEELQVARRRVGVEAGNLLEQAARRRSGGSGTTFARGRSRSAAEDPAGDDRREHQRRAGRGAAGSGAKPARRRLHALAARRHVARHPAIVACGARSAAGARDCNRWRCANGPSPEGLIETDAGVLLVRNVRRGGFEDWSTPGGVIDADDSDLLAGLDPRGRGGDRAGRGGVDRPALRGARRRTRHGLADALRGAPRGRRSRARSTSTTPTASSWKRGSCRTASATRTSSRARPGCASRSRVAARAMGAEQRPRLRLRGERLDPRVDAGGAQWPRT